MKDKFCPLLMISFEPPENKSEPDPRLCNPYCNWYNETNDTCIINQLHEDILELTDYTCAASMEGMDYAD